MALAQALGATDMIDATSGNVAEQIAHLTRGAALNGAIETSGNLGASQSAIAALAPTGACVVIGVPGPSVAAEVNCAPTRGAWFAVGWQQPGGAVPRVFIPELVDRISEDAGQPDRDQPSISRSSTRQRKPR